MPEVLPQAVDNLKDLGLRHRVAIVALSALILLLKTHVTDRQRIDCTWARQKKAWLGSCHRHPEEM